MSERPLSRDEAAEKERAAYNEHLSIGGKALHFHSIFVLGWDARDAEVKLITDRWQEAGSKERALLQAENKRLREALEGLVNATLVGLQSHIEAGFEALKGEK